MLCTWICVHHIVSNRTHDIYIIGCIVDICMYICICVQYDISSRAPPQTHVANTALHLNSTLCFQQSSEYVYVYRYAHISTQYYVTAYVYIHMYVYTFIYTCMYLRHMNTSTSIAMHLQYIVKIGHKS